ncbi:integrase core domain-containing protein, partial [Kushneria aurantia]
RSEPRTRAYVERRTQEGRSKKEIHRCLKRYTARELYPLIIKDLQAASAVPWHRSVNAPTERFFRSLKTEWIPETGYSCFVSAKRSITDYLIGYYSALRPHRHNDGLPPNVAEQLYWKAQKTVA